jgi:hypothetical protein
MIAQIWRGRVPASTADAYHQYLLETGVTDYTATPENWGVYVLQRLDADGGIAHFEILTLWDSLDAIKAFAGDEYARARYYPADDDFLLEREPHVEHLDVLLAKSGPTA